MQHFRDKPNCDLSEVLVENRGQCDYKKLVEMYGGFEIVHKILQEASVGRVNDDTLDEMDTALGRYPKTDEESALNKVERDKKEIPNV